MTRRTDYFDDPLAPPANSIKPSASAFVIEDGRVLLIERDDNGNWSMPGGAHDPGESLSHTAIRETAEESGIDVEVVGLVGIYTDPRHVIHYDSNDEVRQEFTIVYRCQPTSPGQKPRTSCESTRAEWIDSAAVLDLRMDRSQRMRIERALRWPADDPPWLG